MSAVKADNTTFETEVLQSTEPVLVDFWAPWCGPCRAMGSVVDNLAETVDGKAKVVKVNIDEAGELAARYGVQSIPNFTVFVDGEVKSRAVGVVPEQNLVDLLTPQLN